MASTYSDLKIELIGTGEQSGTWGATTNTNLGTAIEEAIVGRATANFTADADLTLTLTNVNTTQVARHYILNVTSGVSLTTTRNMIVPTIDKPYIIENNTTGGQSIVVKTSAGTGVTIPNGKKSIVYANSTNVVSAIDYVPNLTIAAGVINGTTIGATTPSTGAFTTLSSTGNASLGDAEATDTHAIKGATTVLANSASAALTVTQTGAGNAFVVEDSASTDASPFVIDANGRVTIGHTANITPTPLDIYLSSVFATSQVQYSADGNPVVMILGKTRGATPTDNTIVSSGDGIGRLEFKGNDGSGLKAAARIDVAVDGTPGTNDMPGRLVFSTTADGSATPTERMRIDSAGQVGIGGATAAGNSVRISKAITGSTNSISLANRATIQPDVTTSATMFDTVPATAANGGTPYTITSLNSYSAGQGTFNADSTVTNQFGFIAQSTLVGATNNYGFYGNIPSGTGRWNFYAAGTALNYFNGDTLIGTTTRIGLPTVDAKFEVNEGFTRAITIGRSTANANGAGLNFAKSRSATYGSRAAVSANDVLGTINWYADDGTTLIQGAMVSVEVDGTPGTNDMPTRIEFHTKPSGAGSMTERLRIDSAGQITATGNIAGGYVAHAAGTTAMAFGSYNVVRVTPNATATYTSTVPAAGSIVVLSILTSGTTSYTITFGTGFKSTGTLATGTVSARYFNLTFVSDGTNLIETARTVAIA